MALIENIQREDLNAVEIALAYQHLLDQYDLTSDEKAALARIDHATLEAVGVDQRKTSWMARKDTGPGPN